MQINLEKRNKSEYAIIQNKNDIGIIKTYSNSFHANNCYLKLELESYDLGIAEELFKKLLEERKRPLQVMLSSDEHELISFIEKGGFACKRKCYEMEVTKEDYIAKEFDKVDIQRCEKGCIEYKQCCELLYGYYKNTHESINPLTVNFDEFIEILPEEVIYQSKDGSIVNVIFIEDDEIAYVSSIDKEGYKNFISTAVEELLGTRASLCFECDDCDWAAMELCSLFEVELKVSYNTYELQEKSAYLKNPCGTLSIPYWKNKSITIPENMYVVHDSVFSNEDYEEYFDQQYFRLIHRLEKVDRFTHEKYYVKTATQEDIPTFADLINQSYTDIAVTVEQLLGYTRSMVYDADLWILVYEKETSMPVGCGIAEFDKEIREGVLEWIQVLPSYRGQKIGKLIVNELLNRLKSKAVFVTVSGRVDNETKPEKLYRSCGFTGNDIWHILTKADS